MDELGSALLIRARNAIAAEFGERQQAEPEQPRLRKPGATFVTLTQDGQLRGCIGSLQSWRPLDADVRANAHAAAFKDPRFLPLSRDELARTCVEVSLLAEPAPLAIAQEADAIRLLRPHVDGVILEYGRQRATFLPQVWESLPEPKLFLAHLKQKAGLSPDFWAPGLQLFRYEVEKWKETENR